MECTDGSGGDTSDEQQVEDCYHVCEQCNQTPARLCYVVLIIDIVMCVIVNGMCICRQNTVECTWFKS